MNYVLHLTIFFCMYVILSMSLNLVVGYLGRLNLAHAAYAAIGAYTYAIATVALNWTFIPSMVLAVSIAVIMSLALSLPSWRFRGDFFILITLVVGTLIHGAIQNWFTFGQKIGSWANMTNGPFGISGISKPDIWGIRLDTISGVCALSLILAGICAFIIFVLTQSPWGRLLKCLRDDELVLRGLGKNVRLIKLQAFAFSSGMAAVGGVIYATYISYLDPTIASLDESILLLCMLCVGGSGNFRGPVVGAMVLLLLPEVLRFTPIPQNISGNVRLLAYGLLLILIVHLRPEGIAGEYRIE